MEAMTDLETQGIGMTSERTRRRLLDRLRAQGVRDERVLEAILSVPRHLFIEEALAHRAYEDTALPIGYGQTISQPFIVARMTAAVLAEGNCQRVLEVGTGSGYQAAILSELVPEVISIERIGELAKRARRILARLRVRNVQVIHRNGCDGYEKHAPYDGIVVTAGSATIPEALLQQLADGGRLVMPVGDDGAQELKVISRHGDSFSHLGLESVRFVPLIDESSS